MSHRLRASSSAEPRFPVAFALVDGPWPARHVEAIATALRAGLDVEFRRDRRDAQPVFRLRSHRSAVHVLGPGFGHLATMASIPAALAIGWARGGLQRKA